MKAAEWLGRTLMLVLSGLATFAILTSVSTAVNVAPGNGNGNGSGSERARRAEGAAPPSRDSRGGAGGIGGERRDGQQLPQPASSPSDPALAPAAAVSRDAGEVARWLEALTYAVLALAGFAAAGLLALLRIAHALAGIADRG